MATVTYDRESDVLYIEIVAGADGAETEGEEIAPGIVFMDDRGDRSIGIEVTSASKKLTPGALEQPPEVAA